MKTAVLFVLAVLLFADVKGVPFAGRNRCLCMGPGVTFIMPKRIQKVEVFPASPTCGLVEIVITLKESGEKRCLNPDSKFARSIKNSLEHRSSQKRA
ncbi:C-X-C motif chemokine 11-1 [Amia ocellicauda]|uniref:C-X-C motif chemokine 11-1 n=1 Tax=Amia ocellicauda TaxID=2972642 RepID=UPI003463CCB1